jgi:hypothetical protein
MSRAVELIAEHRIAEAIAAGAFRELPTRGALALDDEANVPPAWRLAYRLLRSNGFAPAWIEAGAQIRADLEAARRDLQSVRRESVARSAAESRFVACAAELNRRIDRHNLAAPLLQGHLRRVDVARELAELPPE